MALWQSGYICFLAALAISHGCWLLSGWSLLVQLPCNGLVKPAKDGPRAWTSALQAGEPDEAPGSCCQPSPVLAIDQYSLSLSEV